MVKVQLFGTEVATPVVELEQPSGVDLRQTKIGLLKWGSSISCWGGSRHKSLDIDLFLGTFPVLKISLRRRAHSSVTRTYSYISRSLTGN